MVEAVTNLELGEELVLGACMAGAPAALRGRGLKHSALRRIPFPKTIFWGFDSENQDLQLGLVQYERARYVLRMNENMRTISLRLPEKLDQMLTELANKRGTSRSALLREAIRAFAEQSGSSVADLARDLDGVLEGPEDLSTSPTHMKGYGA
jgi:predicted transcriptional regulator